MCFESVLLKCEAQCNSGLKAGDSRSQKGFLSRGPITKELTVDENVIRGTKCWNSKDQHHNYQGDAQLCIRESQSLAKLAVLTGWGDL